MKILGKGPGSTEASQFLRYLKKAYIAFRRRVSAVTHTIKQVLYSVRDFGGRALSQRNITLTKSDPFLDARLVSLKDASGASSSQKIYVGQQRLGEQTCGTHSANTFFGGPVLRPVNVKKTEVDDALFARMREACRQGAGSQLPPPDRLAMHTALYGHDLLQALKNLKNNRIILLCGLTKHYVSFIRDKHRQWHLVDSVGGRVEKIDSPAAYLESIYRRSDPRYLDQTKLTVSVIHMADEKLPGIPFMN